LLKTVEKHWRLIAVSGRNKGRRWWAELGNRESNPQADSPNDLLRNDLRDGTFEQSAHWSQSLVAECQREATDDKDLMRVVEAWPMLPPHLQLTILSLIDGASSGGTDFPWPERK
jgi:hypothetical protein